MIKKKKNYQSLIRKKSPYTVNFYLVFSLDFLNFEFYLKNDFKLEIKSGDEQYLYGKTLEGNIQADKKI